MKTRAFARELLSRWDAFSLLLDYPLAISDQH
jgi:hypothetical protein